MDFILLTSLMISVFALGASQFLIMRYRVSRYGLLAAAIAFLSAVAGHRREGTERRNE